MNFDSFTVEQLQRMSDALTQMIDNTDEDQPTDTIAQALLANVDAALVQRLTGDQP